MPVVSTEDLLERIRTAKQVTVYQKQSLPPRLLEPFLDVASAELHPELEIVAEDLSDITYLRRLHSSGFELFYGVGLPRQTLIFLNPEQGFVVVEDNLEGAGLRSLSAKDAEDLYFRLLWRRFGHAVLLIGMVKETDPEQWLFCLKLDRNRETWCRLRTVGPGAMPDVGQRVAVFAWEKWVTQILDVIQLELLPAG